MSTKSWRRLAGFIAIKLAVAAAAADFQYRAGIASVGEAQAIAWEDRRGNRAALAQTEAVVTLATSDFVAVQLMRLVNVPREGLMIRGAAAGAAKPEDLWHAIADALRALEPAELRFGGGQLSVTAPGGQCRASLGADGALRFAGCAGGDLVRSPLRAAFRVVEPEHGLQHRGDVPPACPVQAIAFGRQAIILGLAGGSGLERFHAPRLIVVPYVNSSLSFAGDSRIDTTVRDLLRRLKR